MAAFKFKVLTNHCRGTYRGITRFKFNSSTVSVDYTRLSIMSLTLALSEREQNLLTHANRSKLVYNLVVYG